jgi:hypothetical protein
MRRRTWIALTLLSIVVGCVAWGILAIRYVPAFYDRALAVAPADWEAHSTEMFNRSQRLTQETKRPGRWQAEFTADQINGFLAVELPKLARERGHVLPPDWTDPRVEIADGQVTVACRYAGGFGSSVVSLTADVFHAGGDEIGFRLHNPRAGSFPLPLGELISAVSEGARQSGVALRWRQTDGDPVALVRVTPEPSGKKITIDAVELKNGAIRVAGHTE